MANGNRSSRGGSGRRPPAGGRAGGRGRGPARAPKSNAMPMVIAVVAVVAIVGVIVVASGKAPKKKVDYVSEELTGDSKLDPKAVKAKEPERPPPPNISPEIVAKAKEIVAGMDTELAEANEHYNEAMRAKDAGDEATWQAKLAEAREHYLAIRDRWNEEVVGPIEDGLPPDCTWDAEEVANYYVGKEAGKVSKALQTLASISKQLRAH